VIKCLLVRLADSGGTMKDGIKLISLALQNSYTTTKLNMPVAFSINIT
jgi:hypothetical protein